MKKGVIFSTYSALIGESSAGGKYRTRFKQLMHWLGKDFDGLVSLFYSHASGRLGLCQFSCSHMGFVLPLRSRVGFFRNHISPCVVFQSVHMFKYIQCDCVQFVRSERKKVRVLSVAFTLDSKRSYLMSVTAPRICVRWVHRSRRRQV